MENKTLIEKIKDPGQDLFTRITATRNIKDTGNDETLSLLRDILNRSKPESDFIYQNWDPLEAERIVDLYIIEALHRLGDDSELKRIPVLIGKATHIIQGPYGELNSAVTVIRSIGDIGVITMLIDFLSREDAGTEAKTNVVKVLNHLGLPDAPVFGNTALILDSGQKYNYEILMFKEEMETLVTLAGGKIELSAGVKKYLEQNNFKRGPLKIKDLTLAKIMEVFPEIWGFDYYIVDQKIIICTPLETGERWIAWWDTNKTLLVYNQESTQFVFE